MSYHKLSIIILYIIISLPIFLRVYDTSKLIIDEEFHLMQGMHYCNGNFGVWDPKITTFPGLYIVSSMFLYPFGICNTFLLRLTSFVASIINVYLIYEIRKFLTRRRPTHEWKTAIETLSISFLPPMYFFAHLYYTDILSITMVLGLMLFNMKNDHTIAALFGFASVLIRQTNIVWVGMALGITVIDKFVMQTLPFIKGYEKSEHKNENFHTFTDILSVLGFYCKRIYLIPKQLKLLAFYLVGYILVLLLFIIFLFVNGSIVIGDKSAHEAAVHLPQIFYFTLFTMIFGAAFLMSYIRDSIKIVISRWYFIILTGILFAIIIYYNTLIHSYLLADNRHYTFYIWNRYFGRYPFGKYLLIPFYILGLIGIGKSLQLKSAGFRLTLTVCIGVAISLQKLIELRYFIIPYLLIRLNYTGSINSRLSLFLEFILYLIINVITFYIFFTKEIYWSNYEMAQRLIW